MSYRKDPLVENQVYHVFNKSIAGFQIFNTKDDYRRFLETCVYYQNLRKEIKFSKYKVFEPESDIKALVRKRSFRRKVEIISYCIMPTHIHFSLKQESHNGISEFMKEVLDSHTRYFNIKHGRKGPLWEGKFKSILVKDDSQLLHLTRYHHLNPVTAFIVSKPEDWDFSSYKEYLNVVEQGICNYREIIKTKPDEYRKFVEDRINYQRELAKIKNLLFC
ncbi:MAG: hypothetical protein COT17_00900 [Elusimicrobia bacterium CG08_land_8_20_14_0_20_51_18]|nr:MAG: hypothetical protein COT17_00900 [Elusimicrobia bacterium CG08_land_8_20_14_0_20_51_18]